MTKQEFQKLCEKTVFLDGATGSNLIKAGMPQGVAPEAWILEHPDVLHALQEAYVKAGSQIIYAPTFGANPISLARHGLKDRIRELNLSLVRHAKDSAKDSALVAGDVTTTGQLMEPLGDMTYEEAVQAYQAQISLLAEAGADLIVAETMIHIGETCAALEAAQAVCDLPVMCSITVDANGNIFTGGNIFEAAAKLEAAGADAVGVNCSVGPEQLKPIIGKLCQSVSIPVLAKPNAGMPVVSADGQTSYQMEPDSFAAHMKELSAQGAVLLGGCCGTTPEFIAALKKILCQPSSPGSLS